MEDGTNKIPGLKNIISFQSIFRSELFINTSVLVTGSVVAQLIPILLQPFLRRSVPAEFFGAYAVYLSLVGIIVVIASFKYELAIILPRRDKEAANVFMVAFILNAITNIVLLIIIVSFKSYIAGFLNLSDDYSHYLFFVPLGTFLFGAYQGIYYWMLRKKHYYQASVNKLVRRSAEGISQVGLKAVKVPGFLIYGEMIGHLANVVYGYLQSFRNGLKIEYISSVKINYVFRKYIHYPKYNLIPSLIGAGSSLLPMLIINKYYSLENAGYIDLSRMLLSIPTALVSISVSNVLLERISSKCKAKASLVKDLSVIALVLTVVGLAEIIIITFFGEDLFSLVFGSQWGYSGILAKTLVWSYTLNFIITSFYSIFLSLDRIKMLSMWQIIYFSGILSLFFLKGFSFGVFIRIYVIIEIVSFLLLAIFMFSIISDYERKLKLSN